MNITLDMARPEDQSQVAEIWHQGWHDAHAALVPADLTAQRTAESFVVRAGTHLKATRVARDRTQVLGFVMVHGAELFQIYVSPAGRGAGVASALMTAATDQMLANGVQTAWLDCAIGNDRAARFYEKSGWSNKGEQSGTLETLNGPYELVMWRFEKTLSRG